MSEIKPISNDHSGEWHQMQFAKFAAAKAAIGEPVPHMRAVDYMCRTVASDEALWRAGCYLAPYSIIAGEGIWRSWSWDRVTAEGDEHLERWLADNWAGMHTRKPRRCVRTPPQMARCLLGFARWAKEEFPRLRTRSMERWEISSQGGEDDPITLQATNDTEYQEWWKSATSIPFYGRYLAIRLLELSRRRGYMRSDLYDIRAVGAHSPIRCLMLLRPEAVPILMEGKAAEVDRIALEVKAELERHGAPMSFFIFATLLCEYRANYEDAHDYAGNQHDEELEYSLSRYARYWEDKYTMPSQLYEARAAIDPHECLGEIQGWDHRRVDVASWLRRDGVVWSDLAYDYARSVEAGGPVSRSLHNGR